MTFLVIFAVVTVLFMAGVKFTEPDDRDDDRPTWHKRNHE